jgi:hypothetical protein
MAYNLAHHIYSEEKCYDPNYLRGQYDRNLNRYRIIKSELYEYPKKNIELYYLEDKLKHSFSHGISIDYIIDETRNLIGIDKEKNIVYFISGAFYKTCIASDFRLDNGEPETYIPFLKLRLYNYWIENIRFEKNNGDFLFFKAYAKSINREILIKVSGKKIMVKAEDWSEKGSYHWED